jgi:hypothetical protein
MPPKTPIAAATRYGWRDGLGSMGEPGQAAGSKHEGLPWRDSQRPRRTAGT